MGELVDLGTVQMWFDERAGGGDGVTTVLLHGGMCTVDTWAMQVDAIAAGRRVLMPEQRGHGRTADVGEVSYELMAGDTAAFIEAVAGGGPVDLVGWSDGGDVGLVLALAWPDLVRKLVTIGSNFHHEGSNPLLIDGMAGDDEGSMLRVAYEEVSPDGPEHWPVIKAKLLEMWRTGPTLTVEDLGRLDLPVLVLVGDDDAVFLQHTIALFEALPQGQLAVVPGTSHLVPIEKPDLLNRLVVDFLDDGAVVGMLPLLDRRRAAAG